jgi:signal transduction histidine kinase
LSILPGTDDLRRAQTLAEVRRVLLHGDDRTAMLQAACDVAVEVTGLRMAWIGVVEPGAPAVVLVAHAGLVDTYLDDLAIVPGDPVLGAGPTGTAIRTGVVVLCDDIATDPRVAPWRDRALARGYRASAALPVRVAGEVVGALNVYAGEPGAMSGSTVPLLEELCVDIGAALERLALVAELEEARSRLQQDLLDQQRLTRELRQVDELKNTFLSAVSHELRTPLTSLVGFARTLREHEDDLRRGERHQILDRLLVNADRLRVLIDDLLDLDRLARGALVPHRRLESLFPVARGVVEDLAMSEHRVVLEGDDVEAWIDRAKVERILEHLVVNVQQHTPDGTTCWVRVCEQDGGVALVVEDDGPGVRPELRRSVLQAFRQGSDLPVRGAGIGLTLVLRLAEVHGGTIDVTERPGGGTRVTVWLPREAESD